MCLYIYIHTCIYIHTDCFSQRPVFPYEPQLVGPAIPDPRESGGEFQGTHDKHKVDMAICQMIGYVK